MKGNSILFFAFAIMIAGNTACRKEEESTPPAPASAAQHCRLQSIILSAPTFNDSIAVFYTGDVISGYRNTSFNYDGHRIYVLNPLAKETHDTIIVDDGLHILERKKNDDNTGGCASDPTQVVFKYHYDKAGVLSQRIIESFMYWGENTFYKTGSDTTLYTFLNGDLIQTAQRPYTESQKTHYEYYQDTVPRDFMSNARLQEGGSAFTYNNVHLLKSASMNNAHVDYHYSKDAAGRIVQLTTTYTTGGYVNAFTEKYNYACE